MEEKRWVLDGGTLEERLEELREFAGLRPGQSFSEIKVPLIITNGQRERLEKIFPDLQRYIDGEDINELLDDLDKKIEEVGFDASHKLNETGRQLKKLRDELYDEN